MSVTLPYFRDASLLPGPLPTDEEIEAATTTLPSIRDPKYGRIVLIRNKFVVKYGRTLIHVENEGYALLFIEKHLSIPAPRLYAMYRKGPWLYIIMEYMSGENLDILWPALSSPDKQSILSQLRNIFNKMRSLPPRNFFGNVSGGPIEHQYFWTLDKDPAIVGPFKTENDLNLALAKHSRQNWEENARYPWLADFYERNLHRALKDHESVFTHADLQRKNILVEKRIDTVSGEEHYVVSALVDWQTAGWYPSYWEYAGTFCCLQWVDDWPESLEKILDPCPLEAAMLRFVHQDLEF
ncbi:hypothetical protein LOZ57_000475 [Ophidiomyces ophidiicola]|uniref:uncharacterized protein n=1 Tax=Ophidiomyces ophidiicola TaxID=1387563 RepID=UPI0020C2F072|nr:uncharacterized protein LOZ57_000475 [Ophidiomyces ophidiicola]KAI1954125.1 hypothetical protein LOZ57_000475 [Ophidiomyces ophidiicola]KAI2049510.1 hypothetical protein LOZ43_005056 [Ophidiomyces ophidiicola]KAI2081371.1 hypothetical protein LOZ36_006228 [Ophidiomyces ophidiicola]